VSDDEKALAREMIIREGAGLLIMAAVLWYMGPGKITLSGWAHRARTMAAARTTQIDVQAEQFRGEISRWEHEQAAQADHRPGRRGPCGCG
jgi:hypothetical protein